MTVCCYSPIRRSRKIFSKGLSGYTKVHYRGSLGSRASIKTDILIRVEGRNIFIGECKIWRGEKALSKTIDQILSYLNWRDTKAAIILFNRNRNLSDVISKFQETAKAHPHDRRGPKVEGGTRFDASLATQREIMLTITVFDFPTQSVERPCCLTLLWSSPDQAV